MSSCWGRGKENSQEQGYNILFKGRFFFKFRFVSLCLHEFMCTTWVRVPTGAWEYLIPCNWSYRQLWGTRCGFCEPKPGPLPEKYMLLAVEPSSLQPQVQHSLWVYLTTFLWIHRFTFQTLHSHLQPLVPTAISQLAGNWDGFKLAWGNSIPQKWKGILLRFWRTPTQSQACLCISGAFLLNRESTGSTPWSWGGNEEASVAVEAKTATYVGRKVSRRIRHFRNPVQECQRLSLSNESEAKKGWEGRLAEENTQKTLWMQPHCSFSQRGKRNRHKIPAKLATEWYHMLSPSEPCCGKEKPHQSTRSSRDHTAQERVKSNEPSSSVWTDWPLCSHAWISWKLQCVDEWSCWSLLRGQPRDPRHALQRVQGEPRKLRASCA
jgi:hypothetical protein